MTRWMDVLPVVKKREIKLPQALPVNLFRDVLTLISHTYIIAPFTGWNLSFRDKALAVDYTDGYTLMADIIGEVWWNECNE